MSGQDPQDQFYAQRRFICPRGIEGRDKGQRQEAEYKGEGEGSREREKGTRDRGESIGRGEGAASG